MENSQPGRCLGSRELSLGTDEPLPLVTEHDSRKKCYQQKAIERGGKREEVVSDRRAKDYRDKVRFKGIVTMTKQIAPELAIARKLS